MTNVTQGMEDRQLLELAERARKYIGECRLWVPYVGAKPIECTVNHCGFNVSFDATGMQRAGISQIWTTYMDRVRKETVWFPASVWEEMPLAAPKE